MSKKYSISDYDKNVSLKPGPGFWLVIAYFLLPFMLQISSMQMGRGSNSGSVGWLKDAVYPDNFSFFIAVLAALPIIPVVVAYTKRRPGASDFIKKLWRKGLIFLTLTVVLNIAILFVPLVLKPHYHIALLDWVKLAIAVGIIFYLYGSERLKDAFADFPEESSG